MSDCVVFTIMHTIMGERELKWFALIAEKI